MRQELNWRVIVLGTILAAVSVAATPYVTLKLGMSVDLTYAGMFLAAAVLGRAATGNKLAIQLNIIQTMISAAGGVGFMCVILAAFYLAGSLTHRDIGFNPAWWQVAVWLLVSANLGVFMGALTRGQILKDKTLPWPGAEPVLAVANTLTDEQGTETTLRRRAVLTVSTCLSAFIAFLRDGLGVITPMIGNPSLKMLTSLETAAIGIGMFLPLAVSLSGLAGTWMIWQGPRFSDTLSHFIPLIILSD